MRQAPLNNHAYREAVGGIIPGFSGHRPTSQNVTGESAVGGVPLNMQPDRLPGRRRARSRGTMIVRRATPCDV